MADDKDGEELAAGDGDRVGGRSLITYVFVCEQEMKDHLASPDNTRRTTSEDKKPKQVSEMVGSYYVLKR